MLSSLWPPAVLGGAEVYAEELSRHLGERGHDVGVVTLGVHGDGVVAEVPVWPYRLDQFAAQPPWKRAAFHAADLANPRALRTVTEAVDRFRPAVVHCQGKSDRPAECGLFLRRTHAARVLSRL